MVWVASHCIIILAEVNEMTPLNLWREDGERFSINEDGTYTRDEQRISMPTCFYRYTYEQLMNTGKFFLFPPGD